MAKRARIIVVGCSLFGCAVAQALSAAGHDVIVVDMQEDALDGLGPDFDGETLTGGMEDCANDHRIAMAAAIAATACTGPVTVLGAQCVQKSYPDFWEVYKNLGGDIHVL